MEEFNRAVVANRCIFTVCYTELIEKMSKKETISTLLHIFHTKKALTDNQDKTIDEYVEEIFSSQYDELQGQRKGLLDVSYKDIDTTHMMSKRKN